MSVIHLYHISYNDLGHNPTITPKVPYHRAFDEDSTIPRICCCTSIPGCITAMEIIPDVIKESKVIDLYVYEAYIPIEYIYQPTIDELPDVWQTGEFWVTQECTFYKSKHYKATKGFDIPYSCYSRYFFTDVDEEIIAPDRVIAPTIYGDADSFSILMLNPDKNAHIVAMDYFGDHPYF